MIAGILLVVIFACIYIGMKLYKRSAKDRADYPGFINRDYKAGFSTEFSKMLTHEDNQEDKDEVKD